MKEGAEIAPGPDWEVHDSSSPFSAPHGRMYQKFEANGARQGEAPWRSLVCRRAFRASEAHTNAAGIVHGGMLVSFIDALMGMTVARACQSTALTVRLSTDFLSIARPGDWIEGRCRVTRLTGAVAFAEAEANVGDRPLITAHGVFKIMRRREPGRKSG